MMSATGVTPTAGGKILEELAVSADVTEDCLPAEALRGEETVQPTTLGQIATRMDVGNERAVSQMLEAVTFIDASGREDGKVTQLSSKDVATALFSGAPTLIAEFLAAQVVRGVARMPPRTLGPMRAPVVVRRVGSRPRSGRARRVRRLARPAAGRADPPGPAADGRAVDHARPGEPSVAPWDCRPAAVLHRRRGGAPSCDGRESPQAAHAQESCVRGDKDIGAAYASPSRSQP